MKARGKSMLNNQGQPKRKGNIAQHAQKEEIPKLIIRSVGGELKIINNSSNSNNLTEIETTDKVVKGKQKNLICKLKGKKNHDVVKSKYKLAQAVGGSSASILDNVKQRNRRQSKMYTSSSVPLSPTSMRLTFNSMDQLKENYRNPIPSMASNSRNTEIDSVCLNYYLKHPSLNSETFSSDFLPSKKTKLLEHYSLINDKGPSPTSSPFDINELEVASYEEVSTFEPLHPSSEPFLSVSDETSCDDNDAVKVPASSVSEIISPILSKEEKKPVLNTEKLVDDSGTIMQDHNYLSTTNDNVMSDFYVFQRDQEYLDLWAIEEFLHSKEFLVAEKKTDDNISKIVDLAYQIEKQTNIQGISSKGNAAVPSPFKHSAQARQYIDKIVADFKNKTNSKNDVQIVNKPSSPSTGPALSSENGSVKKETYASKEKEREKAMGERNIVYVGNLPPNYTESHLRRRFEKFGSIKNIQLKSKVCDINNSNVPSLESEEIRHFGFITFSCNREAAAAIEGGNAGHKLKFQLSFGARRQFVGEEYRDLDGIVAKNENYVYKCNSRSPVLCQKKPDDDFDMIFKSYVKDRRLKPQLFRMKCKA